MAPPNFNGRQIPCVFADDQTTPIYPVEIPAPARASHTQSQPKVRFATPVVSAGSLTQPPRPSSAPHSPPPYDGPVLPCLAASASLSGDIFSEESLAAFSKHAETASQTLPVLPCLAFSEPLNGEMFSEEALAKFSEQASAPSVAFTDDVPDSPDSNDTVMASFPIVGKVSAQSASNPREFNTVFRHRSNSESVMGLGRYAVSEVTSQRVADAAELPPSLQIGGPRRVQAHPVTVVANDVVVHSEVASIVDSATSFRTPPTATNSSPIETANLVTPPKVLRVANPDNFIANNEYPDFPVVRRRSMGSINSTASPSSIANSLRSDFSFAPSLQQVNEDGTEQVVGGRFARRMVQRYDINRGLRVRTLRMSAQGGVRMGVRSNMYSSGPRALGKIEPAVKDDEEPVRPVEE